ncbi:hypothetical protein Pmani_029347 [Petrolisthes manimaculis]|uniref:Uncharacterized protein n=1 Tax=Petrolisthes manimaculis TaxID=1843537 RepID=A0AAE1TUK8_9EUCA|nr:hypothetical protein Pmani_029347 [Petrolisthes manimaculis]
MKVVVVLVLSVVVLVLSLVVVAGSQTSTRFVLLKNLAPVGPIAVERKLVSNIEGNSNCPNKWVIGGLVLKPDDPDHNTIDYFECRQPTIGNVFTLGKSTTVDTGAGTDGSESQQCPTDNIITEFSPNQRWTNPDNLEAVCQKMNSHVLDGAKCEDVVVSEGPWEGQDHADQHSWNNIMYCPPGYLAVQLVRVREEGTSNNRITSLRCCQVLSL